MNILQIYDFMRLGGAETHIITLSNQLNKFGHNSFIFSSLGQATKMIDNESIYFIGNEDITKKDQFYKFFHKGIDIIKKCDIDLIHAHPFVSQYMGAILGMILDKPLVTTMHSKYCVDFLREEILNKFNKIICISEEVKEKLLCKGTDSSKIALIHNSVPILSKPCKENFFKDNRIRLLYASRIDRDKFKSIENLFKSTIKLKDILDIELIILGEGEMQKNLSVIINEINSLYFKKNNIKYLGAKCFMDKYIDKADIVIGVGRVIVEAISMGKFAICIGEKYYPGLVDKDVLKKISKVNFTDRNTSRVFCIEHLVNDVCELYYNLDKNYNNLEDTFKYLSNNFNIENTALKHLDIYNSLI